MTRYLVYDVFTEKRFGGNQVAIFPEAATLAEADLQPLAAEFNFSEVTYVYPPESPDHTARVRIFTPTMEIPFAGHPTIGTAVALADLGHGPDMVLELGVGPLACKTGPHGASFTTPVPLEILSYPAPALVARALGLDESQIKTDTHAPTMATLGLPFTLTELGNRAALAACAPQTDAFREGTAAYPSGMDFAQFAYFNDGTTLHARMFAPLDNIPEDPATGSASAALAALLAEVSGADTRLAILQGADMGRPSHINVRCDSAGVTVSGQAVRVMQGQLV